MKKALLECSTQLEPDFVWDDQFKVNSISAYVPMTDDNGVALRDEHGKCLGVLGLDITDRQMRAALAKAGGLAIKISLAMLLLALIVSIVLSTLLTRSILALTTTVKRFADKDFTARTPVLSKDEVGQLGMNFNQMAATIQEHSEHLEDLVKHRTKELSDEKQTSERLLLNVLPAPIADRLKSGAGLIVDRFEAVSVLFADIVGFTSLSSRIAPEEPPGKLGFFAYEHVDIQFKGAATFVGAEYEVVPQLQAEAGGVLGPKFGAYVGARYAILPGKLRPVVALGMPLFFSDGARVGVRAAGGVEVILHRNVALALEAGVEHVFNPEMNFAATTFIPALGAIVRL
jgi:HAMP domain-containing protein